METEEHSAVDAPEDVLVTYTKAAIRSLAEKTPFMERIRNKGMTWKGILDELEKALPDVLDDRNTIAYNLVREFLNETFGAEGTEWSTEKQPSRSNPGRTTLWVKVKSSSGEPSSAMSDAPFQLK